MEKARLLVVDDEQGIREGCRRVLEPEGYQVDVASNLTEATRRLADERYELVLLDVMLPDGRGVDLIETIRSIDPDTVVAIITGYATVELAVEAIQQGAYDFLSKPFKGEVLLLTVRQGLERRHLTIEARRTTEAECQAKQLARDKEEMERLDKFKSAFMLTVAHELRAPVAAAQSLVRTLLRGMAGDLTDSQKQILARMEARHSELLELVNDLLDLAASKTYNLEIAPDRVELAPVLERIVERARDEAGAKGVEIIYRGGENAGEVTATKNGLSMIFANIVGNAVKYTPSGGRVEVEVNSQDGEAVVRVSDTGIGIPKEALERLGEEFFRAENAKQSSITGTGLGMSIARLNLDRLGGKMAVQSEVGHGTTVTVSIPRSASITQ
ncbi:MAG TPA: hybrid sensor histidine kinase/response regulator [Anaerolineales bacterium]|nr:hybrid sensor histidine kinase/response regulator [Anaerolineales bacterium]